MPCNALSLERSLVFLIFILKHIWVPPLVLHQLWQNELTILGPNVFGQNWPAWGYCCAHAGLALGPEAVQVASSELPGHSAHTSQLLPLNGQVCASNRPQSMLRESKSMVSPSPSPCHVSTPHLHLVSMPKLRPGPRLAPKHRPGLHLGLSPSAYQQICLKRYLSWFFKQI